MTVEMPYKLGTEARKKRLIEAMEKGEKPVEVNCVPGQWEFLGNLRPVRFFNEKTGRWEDQVIIEYLDVCPFCGKLMLVRALKGTTWLGLDSPECYEKWKEYWKSIKG